MQSGEFICPHCRCIINFEDKCPIILMKEVCRILRLSRITLMRANFPKKIGKTATKPGDRHHNTRDLFLRADVLRWAKKVYGPEVSSLLDQALP